MEKLFAVIVGILCLYVMQMGAAVAQSTSSSVTQQVQGTVKDALGRPLTGVNLRLRAADGNIVGVAQSDSEGQFTFPGIEPGTYAVLADKPEFQSATAIVTVNTTSATAALTMAAEQALDLKVAAVRLDRARNSISPKTGSTVSIRFSRTISLLCPRGTTRRSTTCSCARPVWSTITSGNCTSAATTRTSNTVSTAPFFRRALPGLAPRLIPASPIALTCSPERCLRSMAIGRPAWSKSKPKARTRAAGASACTEEAAAPITLHSS
jgi:hypothetical protein